MAQGPHLLLLVLTLLALVSAATRRSDVGNTLKEHYDDGSEMNQRVILDFLTSELCQQKCDRLGRDALLNEFETFRGDWVDKMITYVINELGLDAESARHVRRNPASYKVNYETFKLLDFR